ncbi:MAG TPA: nucleoside hydrolase [Ilumatobacteraceae bacterium]|nr:nucleoside hydrolase [Ilumatobacteraceae bacterium]HRB04273.1 nucleoside hydrolase [Ilumatobacteraceae bacterium]
MAGAELPRDVFFPATVTAGRTTVLVDCDTGIDDAMALLYLLACDHIEIVGITSVFGNNTAQRCAHNTLRVLTLAGRTDIPVAVGAEMPLVGEVTYLATHVHGTDGLGDAGLPDDVAVELCTSTAVELISAAARQYPGALRILALGPLTNLAMALRADPALTGLVADVVIMGGAADAPGNQTPAAEANIVHDPEAAAEVLGAAWATTLVPLDVTMTEIVTEQHVARMVAAGTPVATFVAAISQFYFDHYGVSSYGRRCSPCHDAVAAAVLTGDVVPTVFPRIDVVVDCTDGPGRGATICDTRARYRGFHGVPEGRCRVALATAGTFSDQLVARLIGAPASP